MHSDRRFIHEALKAGARGYLLKETVFEEIRAALRAVLDGRYYLSASIETGILADFIAHLKQREAEMPPLLSVREREVLHLLAQGLSNAEIASRLCVSRRTVEVHRAHVMRKLGLRDTPELAWSDWQSFADYGPGDEWPRRWARTYVGRSTELVYDWLTARGVSFLPLVNWAERGLFRPGNSVPRWHIAWGTGFAIIEAVVGALESHPGRDRLELRFGHRVERLLVEAGRVVGCAGALENGGDDFEVRAEHLVLASGGICGGDLAKVRANWYRPWGEPPATLLNGSHRFADGLLHDEAARHGAALTHLDLQWHYAAGVRSRAADSPGEGISLVPQLQDATAHRERPAITSHNQGNHGIRSERWRYIRYADGGEELYDHQDDPHEWTNLSDKPEFASIKADLAKWLPKTDAPNLSPKAKRKKDKATE